VGAATPQGFMTVGELAKRMDTTVRTLQYYDKKGLLIPSGETSGGRRLYSDADMVHLHRIQMLKSLGFSLEEIAGRLTEIETPAEMAAALDQQANALRAQIHQLTEALNAAEVLRDETLNMNRVDFRRYAAMVQMLKLKIDETWVISIVGDKMLDRIEDLAAADSHEAFDDSLWHELNARAVRYLAEGIAPDSAQGQAFAADYWAMITEFTQGDMSMLPERNAFAQTSHRWSEEYRGDWDKAEGFVAQSLSTYFAQNNIQFPHGASHES
jgi:DNA-binding transcriptional MerR regulator